MNKTSNLSAHGLLAYNDGCQAGLVTNYLDLVVIDAYLGDRGDVVLVNHRGIITSTP